jgi:hypothetical protein
MKTKIDYIVDDKMVRIVDFKMMSLEDIRKKYDTIIAMKYV